MTPTSEYLFDEESAHISRNEQDEINADAEHLKSIETLPPCICGDPLCLIPYGECHCGCGGKTKVSNRTDKDSRNPRIKGQPMRYLIGHVRQKPGIVEEAKPFKIDGVYCRLIPLGKGFYAVVDETDYYILTVHIWRLWKNKHGNYYAYRYVPRPDARCKWISMHQQILRLEEGEVDHKSGIGIDNRRKNLRPAEHIQNMWNMRRGRPVGFRGVDEHRPDLFRARISFHGRRIHLGYFKTAELAYAAYCEAARKYFGEFARFD